MNTRRNEIVTCRNPGLQLLLLSVAGGTLAGWVFGQVREGVLSLGKLALFLSQG